MVTVAALAGIALLTGLLLLCSAFFSSSETAIFSLPSEWVERSPSGPDGRARVLKRLRDDPHRLLVTLLVGNNVVNVAISSLVTLAVAEFLPSGPTLVVATLLTSVLVLVVGEIVPKAYGLANAEAWSLTAARPLRLVERVLSPVITLFDATTGWIIDLLSADSSIERPYVE